jgi:hypothetical protein
MTEATKESIAERLLEAICHHVPMSAQEMTLTCRAECIRLLTLVESLVLAELLKDQMAQHMVRTSEATAQDAITKAIQGDK